MREEIVHALERGIDPLRDPALTAHMRASHGPAWWRAALRELRQMRSDGVAVYHGREWRTPHDKRK